MEESETISAEEKALLRLIFGVSAKDRVEKLRQAFREVREAHKTLVEFRHSMPMEWREEHGIKLVVAESLLSFALINAEKAGVKLPSDNQAAEDEATYQREIALKRD